jgi:DNA replication protein
LSSIASLTSKGQQARSEDNAVPGADDRQSQNALPATLVERLIQDVWDPLESKAVMTVATLGGHMEPVKESDILRYPALLRGARGDGSDRDTGERLKDALQSAVVHGVLLALRDESGIIWYIVATHETRRLALAGGYQIADAPSGKPRPLTVDRPDVFGLYEQNIGVVTPIMADRLAEALNNYPESWIQDAIGEAVTYNKRNWRYIQRILENWSTEGRSDETNRRDHEEHLDPEKYLRGKYATLFRRR